MGVDNGKVVNDSHGDELICLSCGLRDMRGKRGKSAAMSDVFNLSKSRGTENFLK
ncbi:hypothetical protein C5S39_11220 [Candidatus Methanophagaceae archaeon]|jgi:hypothetical protein|nr:hypothetical protein C5S39_11220 [Methanophagales archaeon]